MEERVRRQRGCSVRIGYVVGGLGRGGAELQLLRLASGMVARGHGAHAIAYSGPSAPDDDSRAAGVAVVAERRETRGGKVGAVRAWLGATRPDVVHVASHGDTPASNRLTAGPMRSYTRRFRKASPTRWRRGWHAAFPSW
jgi:hypothetical protein